MAVTLAARRFPLGRNATPFPTRFLVLDCDGQEVRVAYYRLRYWKENPDPATIPPADAWQHGVEAGWFSEKANPQAWVRVAHRGSNLGDVLRVVLEGAPESWQLVEAYVRATVWGEALP